MRDYVKILKNSLYINKLIVSTGYLILAVIAIFWIKTPIEKVVATYIMLDILMILVINGILTHHKTIYLKEYHTIGNFIWMEGKNYILVGLLTYSIMFYATNYTTNSFFGNTINILLIIICSVFCLLELNRHRSIYYPIISKKNRTTDKFKKMYLFNNHEGLTLEYEYEYSDFGLKSIEKNGIKVEDEYIYMDNVKYKRKHYLKYMKENEISTLEDLTEEDKLLIAMINIS